MNFKIAEKAAVLRMFKLGLCVPEITRRILDSRTRSGYDETLLEIERILRANELTEVEEITVNQLKERGFNTLRIASIILENRHESESYRLIEVIKRK
jgi:hypothetical protein